MAQRSDPFRGSAGATGAAGGGAIPYDLDAELQRLLAEEAAAMEPALTDPVKGNTPAAEATPGATQQTPGAAPAEEPVLDVLSRSQAEELRRRLWVEVEEQYRALNAEVGSRRPVFQEVSNLLEGTRAALLRGAAGVSEAEKLLRQAQGLLQARDDSRRWAGTFGFGILGYQLLFLLVFGGALAFDRSLAAWISPITRSAGAGAMHDILPFWDTMIWGGIGGILSALYALYWHIAELQDFDYQYNMWYVVQPIMGSILGAFVYLVAMAALLALRSDVATAAGWLPAALACLFGFRQKLVFELLDKLMEVIGLRPLLQRIGKKG
jgi:hypothetical protein